jgi:hypothetical protein
MRKPENRLERWLLEVSKQYQYNFGEEGERYVRNMAAEKVVRSFPRGIDALAAGTDGNLDHIYELRHAGSPRHRLFKMIRKEGRISIILKPAKMVVPLSDTQKKPGPTGRTVTKRYRFPARPWIYEYHRAVVIKRKPGTKWMWTTRTDPREGPPPIMGPVRVVPPLRYKSAFSKATKIYLKQEGKMIMSEAARKYAKYAIRDAARKGRMVR